MNCPIIEGECNRKVCSLGTEEVPFCINVIQILALCAAKLNEQGDLRKGDGMAEFKTTCSVIIPLFFDDLSREPNSNEVEFLNLFNERLLNIMGGNYDLDNFLDAFKGDE